MIMAIIVATIIINAITPAVTLVLLHCHHVLVPHREARLSEGALKESHSLSTRWRTNPHGIVVKSTIM